MLITCYNEELDIEFYVKTPDNWGSQDVDERFGYDVDDDIVTICFYDPAGEPMFSGSYRAEDIDREIMDYSDIDDCKFSYEDGFTGYNYTSPKIDIEQYFDDADADF